MTKRNNIGVHTSAALNDINGKMGRIVPKAVRYIIWANVQDQTWQAISLGVKRSVEQTIGAPLRQPMETILSLLGKVGQLQQSNDEAKQHRFYDI